MEAGTRDLFISEAFLISVLIGVIALLAIAVATWRRARPAPIGGLALSTAVLLALAVEGRTAFGVALGVGLLAAAGGMFVRRPGLAVPTGLVGLLLVALAMPSPSRGLVQWLMAIAVVPIAVLLARFDEQYKPSAISLPLLAVSYLGMLVTVPDTERVIVAVGVALPVAIAGWPLRLAHLGRAGSVASAALFVWLAFAGGLGLPGSVVGAIAALGLLIAEPTARWVRSSLDTKLDSLLSRAVGAPVVIAIQGMAALYASRVAGLRDSAKAAFLLALPVLVAVGLWATWPEHTGNRDER